MATSRGVNVFAHKSGEMGFTKYRHVVYRTRLQRDCADWLCRRALSWGITLCDYEGSAALRSLAPCYEAEKINMLPMKLSKQEEQFQFRGGLILRLWVKNAWEWETWIAMVPANSSSPTWLFCGTWEVGWNKRQMLLRGFHCFDREGWSQKFPQEGLGREGQDLFVECIGITFTYTIKLLVLH